MRIIGSPWRTEYDGWRRPSRAIGGAARSGRVLAVGAAVAACLLLVPGCRDGSSASGNPDFGPETGRNSSEWPSGSPATGVQGSGGPDSGGSGTAQGPGGSTGGGPDSGGRAPGNPAGSGNTGGAPGNPGGNSGEVSARGLPIDLGTYDFNPGTTLASYVRYRILTAAAPGCRAKGMPEDCVTVQLVNVEDRVEIPPCPENPAQGREQFPDSVELLASYGESGIDRRLPSGSGDGERAFAMGGSKPPDVVHVYWTHCRAAVTTTTSAVPRTTTTVVPSTTTVPPTTAPAITTTTTAALKPSTVSTISPEVARPSATVDGPTATTTESSGG